MNISREVRAKERKVRMKKPQTEPTLPAADRTSAGLRAVVFDEIDSIRNGRSNPTRANAIAKLVVGIVETVRLEMEVQKHLTAMTDARIPEIPSLGKPLQLAD
jgi:hypothetical protein